MNPMRSDDPASVAKPYRCTGVIVLTALLALAACSNDKPAAGTSAQTGFPGQVTAGGATSGEVMSRTANSVAPMPAGTPGIPQGSGGNPGGAALGTAAQAESEQTGGELQQTPVGGGAGTNMASTDRPAIREGRGVIAKDPSRATSTVGLGVEGAPGEADDSKERSDRK